jgi:uncharacterized protein YegP (UPF0339 family)
MGKLVSDEPAYATDVEGETYKRSDGLYDWRLVNLRNRQVVATSGGQGFTERNDAREGVLRIRPDVKVVPR